MSLGDLYSPGNATLERGFYAFSILLQSFQTIQILEHHNLTSDNLTILKVVLYGVLDDTCQWVSTCCRNDTLKGSACLDPCLKLLVIPACQMDEPHVH